MLCLQSGHTSTWLRHGKHSKWPLTHCAMGGMTGSRHTGHSNTLVSAEVRSVEDRGLELALIVGLSEAVWSDVREQSLLKQCEDVEHLWTIGLIRATSSHRRWSTPKLWPLPMGTDAARGPRLVRICRQVGGADRKSVV